MLTLNPLFGFPLRGLILGDYINGAVWSLIGILWQSPV